MQIPCIAQQAGSIDFDLTMPLGKGHLHHGDQSQLLIIQLG